MICFTSGIRKSSTRTLAGLSGASHAPLRLKAEGSCSSDRRSCIVRSVETCNDIRATEKSIQANVQLSCLWTKLVVNLMRAR